MFWSKKMNERYIAKKYGEQDGVYQIFDTLDQSFFQGIGDTYENCSEKCIALNILLSPTE
jgi:hypothetical protein